MNSVVSKPYASGKPRPLAPFSQSRPLKNGSAAPKTDTVDLRPKITIPLPISPKRLAISGASGLVGVAGAALIGLTGPIGLGAALALSTGAAVVSTSPKLTGFISDKWSSRKERQQLAIIADQQAMAESHNREANAFKNASSEELKEHGDKLIAGRLVSEVTMSKSDMGQVVNLLTRVLEHRDLATDNREFLTSVVDDGTASGWLNGSNDFQRRELVMSATFLDKLASKESAFVDLDRITEATRPDFHNPDAESNNGAKTRLLQRIIPKAMAAKPLAPWKLLSLQERYQQISGTTSGMSNRDRHAALRELLADIGTAREEYQG